MARDKKGNKKIPCVVREFFANLTKLFNSNFKIHAPNTVRTWIKQYNNHEDLTNSRKEGVYLMAKNGARKNTTLEERINIVEECINTGYNYASTANKYGCSYRQVYAWVRKYKIKESKCLYSDPVQPKQVYRIVRFHHTL